jgi:succinate dehydrogenase/fumarate reductase cytochrome b subunit
LIALPGFAEFVDAYRVANGLGLLAFAALLMVSARCCHIANGQGLLLLYC